MNDSPLYTGVDGEPVSGIFGNETVDESTKKLIDEQKKLVAELTPKLQSLVDMIDSEMSLAVTFIADYIDNTKDNDELLRGELKAAARYRAYLSTLKSKFVLALNETKK